MNIALKEDSHIISRMLIRYLDLHSHDLEKYDRDIIGKAQHCFENLAEEDEE